MRSCATLLNRSDIRNTYSGRFMGVQSGWNAMPHRHARRVSMIDQRVKDWYDRDATTRDTLRPEERRADARRCACRRFTARPPTRIAGTPRTSRLAIRTSRLMSPPSVNATPEISRASSDGRTLLDGHQIGNVVVHPIARSTVGAVAHWPRRWRDGRQHRNGPSGGTMRGECHPAAAVRRGRSREMRE